VVLIVDIRRPMPQPFDGVNRPVQRIMKAVYGRHIFKQLAARAPLETQEVSAASKGKPGAAVRA